jgi:hypothetical protein
MNDQNRDNLEATIFMWGFIYIPLIGLVVGLTLKTLGIM